MVGLLSKNDQNSVNLLNFAAHFSTILQNKFLNMVEKTKLIVFLQSILWWIIIVFVY
jgi:hypothetical protein